MKVFISMGLAIFVWSLYALLATYATEQASAYTIVLIMQVVAALSAIFLTVIILLTRKKLKRCIEIHKQMDMTAWLNLMIAGASSAFCHTFFLIALTLAHQGGVALLFEAWPLMAVLMTPFLLNKKWMEVDGEDFLLGFAALIGVGFIIFSDKNIGLPTNGLSAYFKDIEAKTLFGYLLAILGGYLVAVHALTKANFCQTFKPLKNTTLAILISESWARSLGVVFMLIVMFALKEPFEINAHSIFYGTLIGFGVLIIGGGLYTYALLKATSPNVHIFYYFVPVFAVIILYLAGKTELSSFLVAGGTLVVSANIILFIKNRKSTKTPTEFSAF